MGVQYSICAHSKIIRRANGGLQVLPNKIEETHTYITKIHEIDERREEGNRGGRVEDGKEGR